MLNRLQRFFELHLIPESSQETPEPTLQLATAALLVEMTRADFEVKEVERDAVLDAIERTFTLDASELAELVSLAEQEADQATSLHVFTTLINSHYSAAQKVRLIHLLWEVAAADGHIDKYEDYLVRKIADLLYVPHRDFIRSKHAVLEGWNDTLM